MPLPDVMFGGGRSIFTDASVNNRTLLQLAVDRGCSYISTSAQLARVLADPAAHASAPLLGLFAPNHMPYAIDKGEGPTLTDMVNAALAVLKAKGKPCVLFVEGSRIDHALHDNDAAAAAAEVLAYDDAFAAAVHFADGAKGTGSSSPTTVIRLVFIRIVGLGWESLCFGSSWALAAHSSHLTHHTSHLTPHTSHQRCGSQHGRYHPRSPTSRCCCCCSYIKLLPTYHAAASGDPSCYPPYNWDAARLTRFSGSSSSIIAAVCGRAPQPLCSAMRRLTAFDVSDEMCFDLNNGTGMSCSWLAVAAVCVVWDAVMRASVHVSDFGA